MPLWVARIAFEQVIGPHCDGDLLALIDVNYRQSLDLHHTHATELRTTRYNEAMGQVVPPPHTPQHADDILREPERSNSAKVIFRTACPGFSPLDTRLLGPGFTIRLALSFGPARDQDAAVPLPD